MTRFDAIVVIVVYARYRILLLNGDIDHFPESLKQAFVSLQNAATE